MYKVLVEVAKKSRKHLNSDACISIVQFLKSMQNRDGGFRGRNNSGSDLYYTMFAILANLALNGKIPNGVKEYTESFKSEDGLDLIHLCTLARLYSCCRGDDVPNSIKKSVTCNIEEYRSDDGGYHHIARFAEYGTPYGGFLANFAYQELGLQLPNYESLFDGIKDLRTPGMGFSNSRGSQNGTTNATVAALTLLHDFYPEPSNDELIAGALAFLDRMRFSEGGFKAVIDAPLPDLLSTATTLFTFQQWNYPVSDDFKNITLKMIEDHWAESGGFFGNQGETQPDCEYTFYALLALGAL
jgi:hypothetical protein